MIRILFLALVLAVASPAGAQVTMGGTGGPSGRWGSVDVGVQRYRPNIDAEFGGADVGFKKIFGMRQGWLFQVGLSRQLFTSMGTLEVGFRSGYFQDTGKGLTEVTLTPSEDDTKFKMIPTSLTLTYRFDVPVERHRIPLAPYARAALERYNWWVTDGSGKQVIKGATNGWSVTGGLAFLLDILDPTLAREFDRDSGVNHTYLFFEVTKAQIDDFGSSKSWDLSPSNLALSGGMTFVF